MTAAERLIVAHDVDERIEYRGFAIDEDPGDETLRIAQAPNGTVVFGFHSVADAARWIDRWYSDILAWINEGTMPGYLFALMEFV